MMRVSASLAAGLMMASLAAPRGVNAEQGVTFVAHTATIDGARIYYRTGGTGPTLILLHGYAQTSRMWNRIFTRSLAPSESRRRASSATTSA